MKKIMGTYHCRREATDGSWWEGSVRVTESPEGLLLTDRGVWHRPGMAPVRAGQVVLWGDGMLEVRGFVVHRYVVKEMEKGQFRAAYQCGADDYWVEGQVPDAAGWRWRMGVKGPGKDEVQEVFYRPHVA